jgi:hypothetical protein
MERPFNPFGGEITPQPPFPHQQETVGGRAGTVVEQQIEASKRALNYPGRFAPPQTPAVPGTTAGDDDRWDNVSRGAGVK